ncbi:MAG: hypothetical protein KZQ95_03795 [Candidatus Thiodiazotropha sp. (ex Epidulcina cf. delphinae)]|nr:hypothetical protein [Candidatus Thiodiazotropha sp. (ex Epidulcina cf. delphinae)]
MTETIIETRQDSQTVQRLDGVVIGVLAGLDHQRRALVAFSGNPQTDCVIAKSTLTFSEDDIGKEVALLFENGDPRYPLIIGRIQHPAPVSESRLPATATLDGDRMVLSADKEIVLKCGKASITLTRTGKIILRGAYLLSRSSGVNRIKGGSVQIN